ncbi:MAG: leucine-rich repeat protein, partial [Bacteroidales bacterium]|nr:leucine-rich repeat protein [Bacteroidales bacterium]
YKLKTVTLGLALDSIADAYGHKAFSGSNNIETLYYNPKNIKYYGSAFSNRSKLKTVIIGDSVQTLPSNFISGCTAIDSIASYAKVAPTAQSNSFSQVKKDIPVMVPCGSQDSYKSANYWKEFTNIQTKTYDTSVTMSLCYGETFNSRTAMQSGVFVDTLQSTDGCDSIVTINLTVFPIYDTAIYVTTIVDEKGEDYYDTVVNNLQTINGCDSVVTTITFYDYDNSIDTIYNNLTAAICQGETYSFNNNELNAAGVYTQTVNVNKYRDSIITLTLTVNPIYDTVISATICKGQTYSNNGFNTNDAGTHTLNLQTINGCDSTVTLNLNVVDGYDTTITAEICSGESFGENSYGIYIKNLVSSDGCDSVVRVNLVAKQYTGDVDTVHIHDTVTVTQLDTVILHDTITNEITKFDTVTLHDTIETTLYDTVTLFDTIETTLYDTVTLHDTIETTLYDTVTLHDTIETTLYDTVTLHDTIETTLYDTVTLFDTIETTLYDTVTLFDTITVTQTVHDTVNTVDTLTVTEYDTVTLIDTITLTQIDTVTVTDTITLTQIDTVTVTDTITLILHDTVNTIDTVYLHDTITPCGVTRTYIYAEINAGETYNGYGFTESDAGEYTLNLQTDDGCDSIVTLILQVTAGIEEINSERIISIYPNPAHDRVTIHADGDIKIIDNKGQVVREIKNVKGIKDINVNDFEAGVYYINVGKFTQPLIIE